MPGTTYDEYNTAPENGGSYKIKHTSQMASDIAMGSELTAGTQFAFNGKVYTYQGGADAGAGGTEVGFFATSANGKTHFFSTAPATSNNTYLLNSSEGTTIPCFVRGTRVATPAGEATVESVKAGDLVTTTRDGKTVALPIKWVGSRRISLASHPHPETVEPIRIQRGAFADNVPHRDLLVSPDHAVFVDETLICARQLVNGTTIRVEKGLDAVEYFHIELSSHAILLAEGLAAESYLDTGNHGFFADTDVPFVLYPDLTAETAYPARERDSCAPFAWDDDSVRPVWERLATRAADLGQPVPAFDTTADPDLCVVAQGRTVQPLWIENGLYHFMLPAGVTEVRIVSRAAYPNDVRPWTEDRRSLGVYAERIVVRGAHDVQDVPVDDLGLSQGWWAVERDGSTLRRWTDGDAVLPLPAMDGPVRLEIRATGSGMRYRVDAGQQRRAA
jgi:Hint domain